ncbi:MAG: serine protease, partial [Bacteroides sp.]
MKKFIAPILFAFVAIGASAQQDTLKYRIQLTDKAKTTYSLSRPEEFLSPKSIARRQKQHLAIDSTDLPVCRVYVDAIAQKGVKVITLGKWENFVTVSCNDSTVMNRIARLPFVRSIEKVWMVPQSKITSVPPKRDSLINTPVKTDSLYGPAISQIQMSHGDKLHDAGFKGQGMTIAVIDAGFHNMDRIKAMQNIRVLGTRDFVNPDSDIYAESSHGLSV